MSDEKPTRAIERTVEIDAPIEAVWKAISEGEELAKWFSLDARVTPGVGGEIWLSWPGMEGASPISVWEPGKRLQTREEHGPVLMTVDWHLEAKGGKTILRLVHSGFGADAAWDDQYDDTLRGWAVFVGNLQHYLERHRGSAVRQIMIPVPIEVTIDEAWTRLMGPRGIALDTAGLRVGDRYATTAATGDRLDGVVDLLAAPRVFGGTVTAWNDAMLRMEFQGCGPGKTQCWFVILTYGMPDADVEAIRARWTALLTPLFGPAAA
jgi:uncharacterized protein YndB with AHSA1/START domain